MAPLRVMIASPLEREHVEQIEHAFPASVELIYDRSLYPPLHYVSHHHGPAGFKRSPEQEQHWQALAASADVAFDFPYTDVHPRDYAPNLKWVQTTSSGAE